MKIKTNLKSITITSIISFVIYVALMLTVFSCRTVKKEWVEENFTSKSELKEIKEKSSYSIDESKKYVTQSDFTEFTNRLKEFTEKQSENENETTTTKIDIVAEDGKEKSATAGGIKVTSNGANISVESTNTKALSKEYENKYQELAFKEQKNSELIQNIYTKLETAERQIQLLESTIETLKESKTKEVSKSGFQWWVILVAIIAALLFVVYWWFKKSN